MGDYSAQANQIVNAVAIAIANWSTAIAVDSIKWLLGTLDQSTERFRCCLSARSWRSR
jgi:phage-related tail protein